MKKIKLDSEITDSIIALIPENGSRITNDELMAGIARDLGIQVSNEAFNASKDHIVAMGLAEKAKGPGGGLRAAMVKQAEKRSMPMDAINSGGPLTLS